MDLKDFVSGTLIQITEGVKDAQEKCKSMGGLINPMLKVSNNYNGDKYSHDDSDYPATKVYFKVGLTESDCKGNKSGIGVFLGHVSIGNESNKGVETQSVTSVEFAVTAVFPYIDKEGKSINIHGIFAH